MFGSVLLWPFFAMIGTYLVWINSGELSDITSLDVTTLFGSGQTAQIASMAVLYVAMIPLFWSSGRMFGIWWDGYVDARKAYSRFTASKSYKQNLEQQLRALTSDLKSLSER